MFQVVPCTGLPAQREAVDAAPLDHVLVVRVALSAELLLVLVAHVQAGVLSAHAALPQLVPVAVPTVFVSLTLVLALVAFS